MKKKIFIGVAWPYVNGDLHVGHLAGYLLPADICARYNKLVGNDVLMVSGSDCFGTPITIEAEKRNKHPSQIIEEYHEKDVQLFKKILNLSYDVYTKTATEQHIKVVQDFFIKLLENGYIFVDKSLQYYSESEKRFLPDRYVIGECPHCGFKDARSDQCDSCGRVLNQGELINPISDISKTSVGLQETKHYFIDWPKLQPKIHEYVNSYSPSWKEWVRSESIGWLKEGLKPRAITRDIDWGVPIPTDRIPPGMRIDNIDDKRIYVWFDAVIGYFSASLLWSEQTHKDWKDFWYNKDAKHYYFMGKDNLIFHTIFWPGQLIGYDPDLHLPDLPSINMFLDLEGKKFSKSRGIVIEIKDLVEKFGNDRVRFYLTAIMPEKRDSSFSWNDFRDKVNGVLIANIGNFIHRTLSVGYSHSFTETSTQEIYPNVSEEVRQAFKQSRAYLETCEFRSYLDVIVKLASFGNKLCAEEHIWDLHKNDVKHFNTVMSNLYFIIGSLGYLINPLMPEASLRLFNMIYGTPFDSANIAWPTAIDEKFIAEVVSFKLTNKPSPLFSKIEEEDIVNFGGTQN
ncbi:MAG: methionine--tRNA ligase [bacterium]|nr:methionine--tRNA ligase [bacterium]